MKNKNWYKVLSFATSLVLAVTALSCIVPASAETVITEKTSYNGADNFSVEGTNLFAGQLFERFYMYNNTAMMVAKNSENNPAFCPVETAPTEWTDGNANNDYNILNIASEANFKDETENNETQTSSYWKLVFKIDGEINNPQSFVFGFHGGANSGLASQHYAVFASDNSSDLESKKIIEITDTNGRSGDVIDVSNLNLTGIKYVEVRIYHRGMNNFDTWAISLQHVTELGFFGGTVEPVESKTITTKENLTQEDANSIVTNNANRLSGQVYEDSHFYNNGTLEGAETEAAESIKNSVFFDGSLISDNCGAIGPHWGKDQSGCESCRERTNSIFQTYSYRDIVVDLINPINNPDSFVFAFHPGGGLPAKHYAVYMSDSRETLYNDENKIIEITDSNGRVADKVDLSGEDIKNISYVGVRVYSFGYYPEGGWCKILHCNEIGLYGGTLAADVDGNGVIDNNDVTALRSKLLGAQGDSSYNYDVNGDGKNDICDLVTVYNAIK